MTYRQPTAPPPLVISLRKLLIAVDAEQGTALWQQPLPAGVRRLFVVERSLFVALGNSTEGTVLCFDLYTGQPRGSVNVGFRASAGLVREGRLYLASQDGAACLTMEGVLLWRAKVEVQ
jgi:outer membrane protein assembly factor BamB